MDLSEITKALDAQKTAWEEFKKTNDERYEALAKGRGTADLEAKLARIEADIAKYGDAVGSLQAKIARATPEQEAKPGKSSTPEQIEYRKAFLSWARKGANEDQLGDLHRKAMTEGSDPDGGYTVTPEISSQVISRVYETTPMRQICDVQQISSDRLEGPIDRGRASNGGWVGETQARAETATPQIGKWEIRVHEMYAEPRVSQTLLDDSAVNLENWLAGKISEDFSLTENAAFLTGNGVAKPRGLLDYPSAATADATRAFGTLQYIVNGTSGAFSTTAGVAGDKLLDLVYSLKAAYRANARWLMARLSVAEVRKLKDGQAQYLWAPGLTATQPATLLGYPITEGEDMPAIAADAMAIAFGDFRRGYTIVDRIGIRTLRDPYTAKPWVKFYTTRRVGGGLMDSEAVKLFKFGTS